MSSMKNMDSMGLMILLLLLLLPAVAMAQPAIAFSEDVHDFGIVSGKGPLEHRFEVKNDGTEDLMIIRVSPP